MSEKQFLLVSLNLKPARDNRDFVEVLNKATDWIEFKDNTWLVWTGLSSRVWYQRLKPLLATSDDLFIALVDKKDRRGYMPKSFWAFVKSKTSPIDGTSE